MIGSAAALRRVFNKRVFGREQFVTKMYSEKHMDNHKQLNLYFKELEMSKYSKDKVDVAADYRSKSITTLNHLYIKCKKVTKEANEATNKLELAVSEITKTNDNADSLEELYSLIQTVRSYEEALKNVTAFFTHFLVRDYATGETVSVTPACCN
ncbi:hypothetical protein BC830DRAFT_420952 [Chytriomyces sp. MP71]|nr:hypothetical protein BC830DRAFT_420952 [Chytriomyces sp. MP71]